jgi:hypothetical protein
MTAVNRTHAFRASHAVRLLFVSVALVGCEDVGAACGTNSGAALTCEVEAPTSCTAPALRYVDIAPIIDRRCVPCHFGIQDGPWPLTKYEDVADWQDLVRADLLDCSMPPPDGGIEMAPTERAAILQWIRCGYKE